MTITPDTLAAALKTATPGTVLDCAGVFPALALKGRTGLTFRGGTWASLRFDTCRDITLEAVHGEGPASGPDGQGVLFYGGSGHRVLRSVFAGYRTGVAFLRVDGLEVSDSAFERMRSDGVNVAESRNGKVTDNRFHGTRITGDEHPDCIQLWSRPTSPPTADIVIRGNRGMGMTQGITAFNHIHDGVNDGGFDRITIEDNDICGGYPQGIALYEGRNCIVRNNRVETYPGAAWQAKINLVDCTGLVRSGNRTAAGAGRPAVIDAA